MYLPFKSMPQHRSVCYSIHQLVAQLVDKIIVEDSITKHNLLDLFQRRLSFAFMEFFLLVWVASRASAAALSTMLRTTTLSYGNMRFSGTCPTETSQPIKMKVCTTDYVGKITRCAKNCCNLLAGGGHTDR
jgi:hypothetical protein